MYAKHSVKPLFLNGKNITQSLLLSFIASTLIACSAPDSAPNQTQQKAKQEPRSNLEGSKPVTDTATVNTSNSVFLSDSAYQVPYDAPAPLPASKSSQQKTNLAVFAWKEFVALNWPSNYTSSSPTRGMPDTSKTAVDFTQPDNAGQLVWQTYKHRVEVYPEGATAQNYSTSFDSVPQYNYRGGNGEPIYQCGAYTAGSNGQLGSWVADTNSQELSQIEVFNNLDETSEINLATLFTSGDPNAPGTPPARTDIDNLFMGLPQQPRRFIYEAKANRVMFEYVVDQQYYDDATRTAAQEATYSAVRDNGQGGVAPCPTIASGDQSIVCFPPGDKSDQQEGTILVKATWKQLTLDEYNSGRYLTAPIIRYRILNVNTDITNPETSESDDSGDFCYEIVAATPTYATPGDTTSAVTSLPYGLAGLHIIHKTENYPTFVFATFEQVDNINTALPNNELFYYNRNILPPLNKSKHTINSRAHPISDETNDVTDQFHIELRNLLAANGLDDSVWLYYKLIGVQGQATDPVNTSDSDYFLANIVTETNEVLRSFSGTLNNTNGTKNPKVFNIHKGATTYTGGGCKGCHGNAQVGPAPNTLAIGQVPKASDFSFITQNAPISAPDGINQPLFKEDQSITNHASTGNGGHATDGGDAFVK